MTDINVTVSGDAEISAAVGVGVSWDEISGKPSNIVSGDYPTGGNVGDKLTKTANGMEWQSGATTGVDSVNGKTGVVTLTASDVGAAATSHSHAQSDVTGLADALAGKISEPSSEGTNGQVLATDGNGGRSWQTVSTAEATFLDGTESFAAVSALYTAGKDLYYRYADATNSLVTEIPLAYVSKPNGTVSAFMFEKTMKYVIDGGWQLARVSVYLDANGWQSPSVNSAEYQLGAASSETLGGVKVGDGLSVTNEGMLSAKVYSFGIDKEDAGYETTATNAEIYAKFNAGYRVIAHFNYEEQDLPLISATETTADFGAAYGQNVTASGSDVINMVMQMKTVDGVKSIIAHVYGIAKDTDLSNYRTSANQDLIDATKADKPVVETYLISDWTALSSASPFTYSATGTAVHTIGTDTVVRLINNNAVSFATYGFAIGALNGQNITFYSIGEPSETVSLEVNFIG